jgi:predicted  nucleic acid-binding Zn-ribbon protein
MSNTNDIIAELRLTVERLEKRFDKQSAYIAKIETKLRDTENRLFDTELKLAKAQKDSSNSSKSPSSDIVKPPKNNKKSTGKRKKRKQGGQKGHE